MNSEFAIAVHALVFLNHEQESLSSEQIAENVCTHPVRIRKVLSQLKKAGFVATKEGNHGGYSFAGDPKQITLDRVCRILRDTPVEVKQSTGDVDMDCQIASGMAAVMDRIYEKMNERCYDELSHITIDDIDHVLFDGGV
jgi:Rrf2 family protein